MRKHVSLITVRTALLFSLALLFAASAKAHDAYEITSVIYIQSNRIELFAEMEAVRERDGMAAGEAAAAQARQSALEYQQLKDHAAQQFATLQAERKERERVDSLRAEEYASERKLLAERHLVIVAEATAMVEAQAIRAAVKARS